MCTCKYTKLAKSTNGLIRWCHGCETYNIVYNNVLLNFNSKGFKQFKENMAECYAANSKRCGKENRDIYFNTRLDGMQLLFSTIEVAELLALMQDALLHEISFEIYGASEF